MHWYCCCYICCGITIQCCTDTSVATAAVVQLQRCIATALTVVIQLLWYNYNVAHTVQYRNRLMPMTDVPQPACIFSLEKDLEVLIVRFLTDIGQWEKRPTTRDRPMYKTEGPGPTTVSQFGNRCRPLDYLYSWVSNRVHHKKDFFSVPIEPSCDVRNIEFSFYIVKFILYLHFYVNSYK